MRAILLGLSGSGKGTQGALLERRYGIKKLSLGDFLRFGLARNKHNLRARLPSLPEEHAWHPLADEVACELVTELIAPHRQFALDGFPRSVKQAACAATLIRPDFAVEFQCSEATRFRRIERRARKGDTAEKISTRTACETSCMPGILSELRDSGITVITLDAEQSVEAVHRALVKDTRLTKRDIFAFLGKQVRDDLGPLPAQWPQNDPSGPV